MLFVVMLGVFLPIVALIVGAMWGRSYERSIWQRHILQRSGILDELNLDTRLDTVRFRAGESEQLARAIETIAAEVERLGEGQRFLTRLMAEREPHGEKTTAPPPGTARAPIPPTT
jgi:hypothetical protein